MPNPIENYTGIVKTISPFDLEQYTRDGWAVVDTFDSDHLAAADDRLPRQVPATQPSYNSFSDGVIEARVHHVVRERYFVVRKEPESELAQLRTELSAMRTERDDARRTSADWKALSERQTKEIDRLKEEVDRKQEAVGSFKSLRDTDMQKIRKMEGDLGKVRTAIGEIRMREILGEST